MDMRLDLIDTVKRLAVYARVSTSQQDIETQVIIGLELAAKLGYDKEKVMIIKDDAVSSLQVKLEDRIGMTDLLRIMKDKVIDTLIVFDRDRLARNMVEYLVIAEQAIIHGIEIIFSNGEAEPFTNKLDREADLALYAEMEGKKINQRTAAVRKYYPPAPFGYQRVGKRSSTRYVMVENDIEQVIAMFKDFKSISTKIEFIQFKKGWETQKGVNCKRILTNSFYAGVIIHANGLIEPLQHIKGIVRKETILENRLKINAWGYNQKRERPRDPYFRNLGIPLICGKCNQSLKIVRRNNEVSLSCNHGNNGRKAIICTVSSLKNILQNHVQKMIERLNTNKLKYITDSKISEHLRTTHHKLKKLEIERVKAVKRICGQGHSSGITRSLQSIQEFNQQINDLNHQYEQLMLLRNKLNEFVNIIKSEFHRHFPEHLNEVTRILVKEIRVGNDYVDIQTRASECFEKAT